jgi:hypothetical protein
MPTITVSKQVVASPDTLWAILADFGNVDWIPGAGDVRVEGEGPGMRRTISGSGDVPIVETLLWINPEERALSYEISNNPLPVSRFVAVATVSGVDSTCESAVAWEIDYEPAGDDAAARGAIEAVYGLMAGWLEDAAKVWGS